VRQKLKPKDRLGQNLTLRWNNLRRKFKNWKTSSITIKVSHQTRKRKSGIRSRHRYHALERKLKWLTTETLWTRSDTKFPSLLKYWTLKLLEPLKTIYWMRSSKESTRMKEKMPQFQGVTPKPTIKILNWRWLTKDRVEFLVKTIQTLTTL